MTKFETSRLKYKPDKIRYLLIAEAPPKADSNRFFYFEDVLEQDSLFLETMKCLYPDQTLSIPPKSIRKNKKAFLERFKQDGFYLVDSLDKPFDRKLSSRQKEAYIRQGQSELLKKIEKICGLKTEVILIAATVFRANYSFLTNHGINIINTESIDFPGSGGQRKFKEKLVAVLR